MGIIVGVDEAGRGPVLGPLVMVALAIDEKNLQKLQWMGVKDSKLLSKEAREELFDRIHEVVLDFRIEVIEPDAIDLSLKEEGSNLNWLEAETTARLVSPFAADSVIIDCPSVNIPAYREHVAQRVPKVLRDKLVVEHKADFNHLIVAAASVIAKVIRDRAIEHYQTEIGINFGSGYMSDVRTQQFLNDYYDVHSQLFRKEWKSYKDAVERRKQRTLGEY